MIGRLRPNQLLKKRGVVAAGSDLWKDGKVRNETVANLSRLPVDLIDVVRRGHCRGRVFVPASMGATVTRSLPHGHVAAQAETPRHVFIPDAVENNDVNSADSDPASPQQFG